MGMDEFFQFAVSKRPLRTHLLSKGDYAVLPHPFRTDRAYIEKIAELDSPEKGNFVTSKGTTGSISRNVFIIIKKGKYPEYLLVEGDKVTGYNGSVYDSVRKYLESKSNLN